jgi:hypothetical protein
VYYASGSPFRPESVTCYPPPIVASMWHGQTCMSTESAAAQLAGNRAIVALIYSVLFQVTTLWRQMSVRQVL